MCTPYLQLVKKCNEGAKRMEQTEQLCMIEKQLDFKIKVKKILIETA